MNLSIHHETHYDYSAPLRYALQSLRLTPQRERAPDRAALGAARARHADSPSVDGYGNHDAHLDARAPRVARRDPRAAASSRRMRRPWLSRCDAGLPSPQVYLRPTDADAAADDALRTLGRKHLARGGVTGPSLLALADEVCAARVRYRSRRRPTCSTTAARALEQGAGRVPGPGARDSSPPAAPTASPARYVSGYFYAPDVAGARQPRLGRCLPRHRRAALAQRRHHASLPDGRAPCAARRRPRLCCVPADPRRALTAAAKKRCESISRSEQAAVE